MPTRIVVGMRVRKKYRIQVQELTLEKNKDKTKGSKNMVLFDEDNKLKLEEIFESIETAVTKYAESKGEVNKY